MSHMPAVKSLEDTEMFKNACFLTRLLALSVKSAEAAGQQIKKIGQKGELGIVEKGKNDVQTLADRAAQVTIVDSLRAKFGKEITIIGEEQLDEESKKLGMIENDYCEKVIGMDNEVSEKLRQIQAKDVTIWVDPLDGTSEFAESIREKKWELLEQTTVLIGIGHGDEVLAGVMYQPFFGSQSDPIDREGRAIWAFTSGAVHGLDVHYPKSGNRSIVTTRSHGTGRIETALNGLKDAGLVDEVVRVGGAGYKVLRMLEGGAAAYIFPSPGTKKWDTCAPQAILEAAGGLMTDVHGNRLNYSADVQWMNSAGVVATAKGIDHLSYTANIPTEVKDQLKP